MHTYSSGFVLFVLFLTCLVTSAWWVPFGQVQMRDGGHDVRGKKNYLPPAMLVLGYGVLWTTEDQETMQRHERPLVTTEAPPDPDKEKQECFVDDEESDGEESSNEIDAVEVKHENADDEPTTNEAEGQREDKYNLDEFGSPEVEQEEDKEEDLPTRSSALPTKRRLTAKQRRDLKKGKSIPPHPDLEKQKNSEDDEVDEATSTLNATSISKPKPQPIVRGKKGKLKKMKAKYADQSDEERELARKLLGGKAPEEKNPEPAPAQPIQPIKKPPAPPSAPRPEKPIVDEALEVPQPCRRWLILPGPRFIRQGIHCGSETRGYNCRCSDSLRPVVRLNPL